MTTASHPVGVADRLALTLGSALVRWASRPTTGREAHSAQLAKERARLERERSWALRARP